MNVTEYTLTTDEFGKPRVLEGPDAIAQLFIHLILLEPGTYSERPEMGVGLVSRWRYTTSDDIDALRDCIKVQIATYLPDLSDTTVDVKLNDNHELYIGILHDGILYKYETNKQDDNSASLTRIIGG